MEPATPDRPKAAARSATPPRLPTGEQLFRLSFDNAPIGMALVALDGRILRVNPALSRLTGYGEAELLERTFQDITHPDDVEADVSLGQAIVAGTIPNYQLEKRYFHARGHFVWGMLSVSLARDPGGEPVCFVAQVEDITDRKRLESRLRHLADHDQVTGLFNRHRFVQELEREIAWAKRHETAVTVLMIDLDNFKATNDEYGHEAGDLVLQAVAGVLEQRLRKTDVAARFGGDEFVVALPEADRPAALTIAEELHAAIEDIEIAYENGPLRARASIGASTTEPGRQPTLQALIRTADADMYRVKRSRA